MTGSKSHLFKGNPGFSTKKIQIRVPGISPAKNKMAVVCQTRGSCSRPCIYGPALLLGELRIENYVFANLKLSKLLLLVKKNLLGFYRLGRKPKRKKTFWSENAIKSLDSLCFSVASHEIIQMYTKNSALSQLITVTGPKSQVTILFQ